MNITLFISCPEVVLDSFDDECFDILFFFEGNRCAVDQLAVLVVGESWSRASSLIASLLDLIREECNSFDDVSQHIDD